VLDAGACFVASSAAPILRAGCASATTAVTLSPSSWPAGQSERLAIGFGVSFGSGRPASAGGAPPTRPDALNWVTDPAAGLRPEAP